MKFENQFQLMAGYNQWMNDKLYAVCQTIPDEKRKADLGAYFKSIHGTLNHIMWGDRAWMNRLSDYEFEAMPFGESLFTGFEELSVERRRIDELIVEWVNRLAQEDLAVLFQFSSILDGKTRKAPKWVFILQMFNHQTHHRGQMSTLIHQLGYEFDNTDIPWLPGAVDYL